MGAGPGERAAGDPVETLYYLHDLGAAGWKLTGPRSEPWGQAQTLEQGDLRLIYYQLDEPYVTAALPRLEAYVGQAAEDLGVALTGAPIHVWFVPMEVGLPPQPEDRTDLLRMPGMAHSGSRFEDFVWAGADFLGHQLVERVHGGPLTPQTFPCLAEAFIQVEVAEARGGQPSRESILRLARLSGEGWSLQRLLDPADTELCGERLFQQMALLTFVVETYGRDRLGALLQALFTQPDWRAMVRNALNDDPARFDRRWTEWLAH